MKPVLTNQGGTCAAFPDTCKTPSPGGPVPIPYPNVTQCSDGSGSSKVLVLNKQTLRKGDTFRMSSGDEGGTAGGSVISNRIKGQSEIKQGYDKVKVEGKDVAHLLVTVGQNGGSTKSSPNGKAVAPGQTKVKLMTVRGKKRQVRVKVRKFKKGETKVPPTKGVNDAAEKLGRARNAQNKIQASEALGDAGARSAMRKFAEKFGGLVEGPLSFSGSGVVDVLGVCANGVVLVFEAKGGGSQLGTRVVKGVGRCLQGTPKYLRDIAASMKRSSNRSVREAGKKLRDAITKRKVKYCEARTGRAGKKAKPTRVREFDP